VSWEFTTPDFHGLDDLVVTGDTIYASTRVETTIPDTAENPRPNLYAIDISTGTERWSATNLGSSNWLANIGLDGDIVYAFHQDGIEGFHKTSGEHTLNKDLSNGIGTIHDGVAYVTARPLRALDLPSFEQQWTTERDPEMSLTLPTVHNSWVFFADQDGTIYCVDRSDGSIRWTTALPTQVHTSRTMKIRSGFLWALDNTSRLHAIDLSTGTIRYTMDAAANTRFEVTDDLLVVRADVENSYDTMLEGYRLS